MTTQTAFRLDDKLLSTLKQLSKDDGRSMTWHVDKALKAYLGEPKKEVKKRTVKKFVKPTVQEVQVFCFENGYDINAQGFMDYYDSQGWKVGKNPMKDWKATIRTWVKRKEEKSRARESLIQRTERKAQESITAIEAAENALDSNGHALWLQVDKH